jgi:RecB family exonuclease
VSVMTCDWKSGGIEVIDYKTGKGSSQSSVDQSLQLSIYALACRDAALGPMRDGSLFDRIGGELSCVCHA